MSSRLPHIGEEIRERDTILSELRKIFGGHESYFGKRSENDGLVFVELHDLTEVERFMCEILKNKIAAMGGRSREDEEHVLKRGGYILDENTPGKITFSMDSALYRRLRDDLNKHVRAR